MLLVARAGQNIAPFSGTLARGEHESYLVRAERNELVEVWVDRVHGRDIVARALDAANKTALDGRAQKRTRLGRSARDRRRPDRRRESGADRRCCAHSLTDRERPVIDV